MLMPGSKMNIHVNMGVLCFFYDTLGDTNDRTVDLPLRSRMTPDLSTHAEDPRVIGGQPIDQGV